ncbi:MULTISPECIES: SDR family NAD(P)-dependent oxidoreductase [Streptomyces]|uniref:Oxidoreductase n=1 Tax=Streptomyces albus (strain ATCC 21838 / DSM 41398 / FERM P-419 / JCM 4703 / NBRC 107858) TaxID=1081613 RepID=A0A0B5EY34_STRA4|nr:SDR family oxidoreductase [Streptomyces sp. SCSIO ZS0520]AJE83022.1 oxidoreductase [Streptomyces albus]AOU77332.1 oxidoreductase [Streptomyces albus]AYN33108.1 oxidoreductase [Streptomyces albus]
MPRPVTIVTGGSRGIGAAVCVRLAAEGHDLVLGYRTDGWAAEETAAAVRAAGVRCLPVRVDVAEEADVERLFDRAAAELGPVTGLVNNAGVTGPLGPLAKAETAGLRRVLDVNILGTLLSCRRAAQDMTANGGGAIVNISSAAATLGSPGEYVHYAAAKAAVDTLTLGLAKELGPEGIRVNAVAPGVVTTGIHAEMGDADRPARVARDTPLRRPGEPEEIAAAVAWLLSEDASYATGTVVRVAGGR